MCNTLRNYTTMLFLQQPILQQLYHLKGHSYTIVLFICSVLIFWLCVGFFSLYSASVFVKVSVFGVILARIFPYSVRVRENVGQNNSEYWHFLLSDIKMLIRIKAFIKGWSKKSHCPWRWCFVRIEIMFISSWSCPKIHFYSVIDNEKLSNLTIIWVFDQTKPSFFYNNVVYIIQTIFTTNNNYSKTWDYTNTIPITRFLGVKH